MEVSVEQVKAALDRGEPLVLLDCREPHEWAFNRIDGAVHIPMNQVIERLDEVDGDTPVVVYCHHGVRSLHVAGLLRRHGCDRVQSMAGGIDAWSQRIDRNVPRY